MNKLELHPLCTLFPRMADAEFSSLVADIKANGLRESITIHGGMILDGGNRYRACIEAGIEPDIKEYTGGSIVSYVLSANLHRRHLSAGQQAAIVASAQDWAKAQTVGKPKSGNVTGLETVANRQAQSGASDKTQRDADKVAKASPELAKQVAHGEISLPKAVEQITGKKQKRVDQEEVEEYDPREDEAKELADTVRTLAAENDSLKDRIATGVMVGTDEEKTAAIDTIKSLRSEVKQLQIALDAVTLSRDSYQRENTELKIQIKRQSKQLEKAAA